MRARRAMPDPRPSDFEAEVIGGLEPFAARELAGPGVDVTSRGVGSLRFLFAGPWPRLLEPRTVVAVHAVVAAGLPRPSTLLDDGVSKHLVGAIGHIRSLHPSGSFATFRLSAAGADSPTFRRVRDRLARATGLRDVSEGGDLVLRFRPGPSAELPSGAGLRARPCLDGAGTDARPTGGFELTARISPRPLSTRSWRVCNLPGALNATVARVMADLTAPTPDDVYVNLACGSGTLLIERALLGPARRLVGCDTDARALTCAAENVAAADVDVELMPWDATAVPLPDGSASALVADLPFGQLVGSHQANERFYPQVLAEAARLATPGARFVAITQQVNLFERCLRDASAFWDVDQVVRLALPANAGVLKPRVYVLRRGGSG